MRPAIDSRPVQNNARWAFAPKPSSSLNKEAHHGHRLCSEPTRSKMCPLTGFVEFLCDTAIDFAVTTAERAFTLFVFTFPPARWTFDLIAS